MTVQDHPTIRTDDLFARVRYQPVRPGRAVGRLVRVAARDLADADLEPQDILLTDEVPLDLPPVSGIVTSELQTPLAHIAVLAHSRGIPDMALRGAFDDPAWTELVGQWIELRVTRQRWTTAHSAPVAPAFTAIRGPRLLRPLWPK